MKSKLAAAALIALASQAALAEQPYWDSVQASFSNLLDHAPYYGPTATTVALDQQDPAAMLIHAVLRGESLPALARQPEPYFGNVAGSFNRMLGHPPYAGATGVTVARQLDHRVDSLVFALSRENKAPAMTMAAGENEKVVK